MDSSSPQKNTFRSVTAHAAVILAGCMWGACGIFVRTLDLLEYSPLTIVFVRMSIAFAIAFTFLLFFNKNLLRIKTKDIWVFIGAALNSAIILNLFYSLSVVMNSLSGGCFISSSSIFCHFHFCIFIPRENHSY